MKQAILISVILFAFFSSCTNNDEKQLQVTNRIEIDVEDNFNTNLVNVWCDSLINVNDTRIPDCVNKNWVFTENNRKMLYGGNNPTWHFDISNWLLDECNLRHGLGREVFQALIDPKYYSIEEAENDIRNSSKNDNDRYIIVLNNDRKPKAYSFDLLTKHEVINEVVDGAPIAIVYCFLADLGAVYSRVYNNKTFTFALSGYTYRDENVWNGIDGFVFWDRETESLWWPLIDKAVSGIMMGTDIKKHNTDKWLETTWQEIKELYPNTIILKPGQTMDVPSEWPKYNCEDFLD